jgi:hypothetical protein
MTAFNYPRTHDLSIIGLFDPGIANRERIVLRVEAPIRFRHYYLSLALRSPDGFNPNHLIWLGYFDKAVEAKAGAILIVYSGSGENLITAIADAPYTLAYVMHWGRDKTLIGPAEADLVVPMLLRVDAVGFPLPQPVLGPPRTGLLAP